MIRTQSSPGTISEAPGLYLVFPGQCSEYSISSDGETALVGTRIAFLGSDMALPLTCCVSLGQLLNFSALRFCHPQMIIILITASENYKNENEFINVKYLAHGKCLINIGICFYYLL